MTISSVTKLQSDRWFQTGWGKGIRPLMTVLSKYRLAFVFGVTAVVAVAIFAAVSNRAIVRTAESGMTQVAERHSNADAQHLVSMLRGPMMQGPSSAEATAGFNAMDGMQGPMPLTLESLAGGLSERLPAMVEGLGIAKINVLDLGGLTVWSSSPWSIGDRDHTGPMYERALAGQSASEFVRAQELVNMDGLLSTIDAVETYVPLRETPSGPVIGVIEVHRDVTDDVGFLISDMKSSVMRTIGVTMGGLLVVLMTLVVASDVAINISRRRQQAALEAQLAERQRSAKELAASNGRLEQVLTELKETQQQVVQQERLRALGQMASGISHDFNNLLTPIVGYSELLLTSTKHMGDKDTIERYLRLINTAGQDAANVVKGMREFYRSHDEEEFTPIGLNELVGQAISLTQARWKDDAQARGVSITLKTDLQETPPVSGDESQLREVLINLILNAADAMQSDGTITVGTRIDDEHVVVEVGDTGSGMTQEVRRQCLEPFFTTKGNEGTGLGLSMVYGIIVGHRGTVDIESEVGQGTTFTIRLPVHTSGAIEPDCGDEGSRSIPAKRILVVDDEPTIRELVADYLTADGHSVETAADGRDGLKRYLAGSFELVVTDRAMPEMNGDQLASAIKQETPGKPIIMLSGFGDIIRDNGERPEGVDIVLSKPVKRSELRQAVAETAVE